MIAITHVVIDRYRLAAWLVWAKNQMAPPMWRHPYGDHVSGTGYHRPVDDGTRVSLSDPVFGGWALKALPVRCQIQAKPEWMSVWLMIVADNTVHVVLNSAMIAFAVGGR